jgi:phosphomevalonate kinase
VKARAPGKLVVSGAYSVLVGAPAIVAAVDRYVEADAERPAELVTAEVGAAIAAGDLARAPWFDANALRRAMPDGTSRKLGLGSSAAILAASLGASLAGDFPNAGALRRAVFPKALAAHKAAQPAGSGVDVAASVFGGVLYARIDAKGVLAAEEHPLPGDARITVFAAAESASTADMLARIDAAKSRSANVAAAVRLHLDRAAAGAVKAIAARNVNAFAAALTAQYEALFTLGSLAKAPIVTGLMYALGRIAKMEGAAFGPAGAGGGDVCLYTAAGDPSAEFLRHASDAGFERLELALGASGLERYG